MVSAGSCYVFCWVMNTLELEVERIVSCSRYYCPIYDLFLSYHFTEIPPG